MSRIQAVLFDIGGVLTSDPWQSIVLTPQRGLADRLGIEHAVAEHAGESLWSQYSLYAAAEDTYWRDFAAAIGRSIPREMITQAEDETLRLNPRAHTAFHLVAERGLQAGFVSDNTAFWYPKQVKLIGCQDCAVLKHEYLSFATGLSKQSTPVGLFQLAARELSAKTTLVIDDRPKNLDQARHAGFATLRYSMDDADLAEVLQSALDAA